MLRSKELIEDRLGVACRDFAFPWAVASPAAVRVASAVFRSVGDPRVANEPCGQAGPVLVGQDAGAEERRPVLLRTEGPRATGQRIARLPAAPSRPVGADVTARVAHVSTVDLTPRFLLLAQLRGLRDAGFDVTTVSASGPWVDDLERRVSGTSRGRARPGAGISQPTDGRSGSSSGSSGAGRFDLVHTHNPKARRDGPARGAARRDPVRHEHRPRPLRDARGPAPQEDARAGRGVVREQVQRPRAVPIRRGSGLGAASRTRTTGTIDVPGQRDRPLEVRAGLAHEERVAKTRRDLGFADEELVVGTVGRIVAEKGYRGAVPGRQERAAAVPGGPLPGRRRPRPGEVGRPLPGGTRRRLRATSCSRAGARTCRS